jgi:glycosyltransferase involved in cell wall biosynthesis
MNNRVLIIGPILPPLGGVSLHIDRLTRLIKNDFNIDLIDESRIIKKNIFNIRSLNLFHYFKKVRQSDLIYIHSGVAILRYSHIIFGRLASKKIIITIHSYPNIKKPLSRHLDEYFFKLANRVIVVHRDILERLSLPVEKCIICSAFMPPAMDAEPNLPSSVSNWIYERRNRARLIICANATHLKMHNNQDLYGLDMCIEVAKMLIKNGIPVSFVYNVSSLDINKDLYLKYQTEVENSDIKENFLLISESLSFVRLIEQSDIVLRPTNTDGDSLSVREALCLGKPVIASDIVKRPVGAILFKSRDITDFEARITEVIKGDHKSISDQVYKPEQDYQRFYSDLLLNTIKMGNDA